MLKSWIKNLYSYYVIKRSGLFDREYYLRNNLDVARNCLNPLMHFIRHGHDEGRNPSRFFDIGTYRRKYQDVAITNINSLYHFVQFGFKEGRNVFGAENCDSDDIRAFNLLLLKWQRKFDRNCFPVIFDQSLKPKVTVIVPNYNHAKYLRQRLDCIYSQTYKNFDVILLDDCSTDDSRKILQEYQQKYPKITKMILNQTNGGQVFKQWEKGIALADGDLIWIAESDDYADTNFIEALVPFFADESVMLAYAHNIFVNESSIPKSFTFESYLSELGLAKWKNDYVETASREVARSLGIKNTIPNVSCALFRKPEMGLLDDDNWRKMKICGDWIFYLRLIQGGKIAYSNHCSNYYRFHEKNSSAATYTKDTYFTEHEAVACCIAEHYNVSHRVLDTHRQIISKFWSDNYVPNGGQRKFSELYDADKVHSFISRRKPNILMAGFAFQLGGGEIFPIVLANRLKELGYGITYFDFDYYGVDNPLVRRMLSSHIPVVKKRYYQDVKEICDRFAIDIIHTHHAGTDSFFAMNAPENVRHIVTLHGMYETMSKAEFMANEHFFGKIDKWVYLADKNLEPFKACSSYDPCKFVKIGNGLKLPTVKVIDRSTLGIPDDAFVLCVASRAMVEKGWLEAIEATIKAREFSQKNIHLLLLGTGDLYEELVTKPTLPHYIHLLGFKSNVGDYFAMSNVGLLPSRFKGESFPLTIIECLFAGKPVIASDVGEISNMLTVNNGSAGAVFKLTNGSIPVNELAELIADFAAGETTYIQSLKRVAQCRHKFDIDVVVGKYEAVYTELMAQK